MEIPLSQRVRHPGRYRASILVLLLLEAGVIGLGIWFGSRMNIGGMGPVAWSLWGIVMASLPVMFLSFGLLGSFSHPIRVTHRLRLSTHDLEITDGDGVRLGTVNSGSVEVQHTNGQVWTSGGKYRRYQLSAAFTVRAGRESFFLFPLPIVGPHAGIPTDDITGALQLSQEQYFLVAPYATHGTPAPRA